jgi:ribosomal-protein-alanine N-acetyltransferase
MGCGKKLVESKRRDIESALSERDGKAMTHKGTVTLETERLILRQISLQDAHDVFVWMSDPEVCRYERWQPHTSVEWTSGYISEVFDYSRDVS